MKRLAVSEKLHRTPNCEKKIHHRDTEHTEKYLLEVARNREMMAVYFSPPSIFLYLKHDS